MLRILQVQFNLLRQAISQIKSFHISRAAQERFFIAEQHRGHVRDARLELQNLALLRGVALHISRHLGTRPHEAHIAHQHVPELGQFIQLGLAQKAADPGDARILVFGQRHAHVVGIDDHGPEFPDAERLPELADPGLPVEDGTPASELDQQANQQPHRPQCQ